VVVLSQVLATNATLGYEDIYNVQVRRCQLDLGVFGTSQDARLASGGGRLACGHRAKPV
jgi:hypothetical protein